MEVLKQEQLLNFLPEVFEVEQVVVFEVGLVGQAEQAEQVQQHYLVQGLARYRPVHGLSYLLRHSPEVYHCQNILKSYQKSQNILISLH